MKTYELFEQYESDDTRSRYGLEFLLRSAQLSHEELLDAAEQLIRESGGKFDNARKHRVKKSGGAFAYNMIDVDSFYPLDSLYRGKDYIMKKARRMSRSPKAPWYLVSIRIVETTRGVDGRVSKRSGVLEFGPKVRK